MFGRMRPEEFDKLKPGDRAILVTRHAWTIVTITARTAAMVTVSKGDRGGAVRVRRNGSKEYLRVLTPEDEARFEVEAKQERRASFVYRLWNDNRGERGPYLGKLEGELAEAFDKLEELYVARFGPK